MFFLQSQVTGTFVFQEILAGGFLFLCGGTTAVLLLVVLVILLYVKSEMVKEKQP